MHNLDFSKGKAGLVMYQAPAWHKLGKVYVNDITPEEAYEDSGADFKVEISPNIHRLPNGIEIVSKNSFFTYRTDTMSVLGDKLGREYAVYQNKQAFDLLNELLDTGKVKIETAGCLDGGRRVFICLRFEKDMTIGNNETIYQYLLLAWSHDGSLAITAMPTNVRVVCWNTLSAALAGAQASHKIRHTINADTRIKEALAIMGILEKNAGINEAAYNAMYNQIISKEEFFDYIGNIFLSEEQIQNLQKNKKDAISTRSKNVLENVIAYANNGQGQQEALLNGEINAWWAYNAVTGYITTRPFKNENDRFKSLIFNTDAAKIKNAGYLALNPQKIQTIKAKTIDLNLN